MKLITYADTNFLLERVTLFHVFNILFSFPESRKIEEQGGYKFTLAEMPTSFSFGGNTS